MNFEVINTELVTNLVLLLLIGLGPKIALVPFLEKTKNMTADDQRKIGKAMVKTAVISALALYAAGALLMRLLHVSSGAISIAGGIVLLILALRMALGSESSEEEHMPDAIDHDKIAVYPLAIPYLLNPVGIAVIIIASSAAHSVAANALLISVILAVGAMDYLVFSNIDKLAKRMRPTTLVVSEVVFGILLTALAVEMVVNGLGVYGIIDAVHH